MIAMGKENYIQYKIEQGVGQQSAEINYNCMYRLYEQTTTAAGAVMIINDNKMSASGYAKNFVDMKQKDAVSIRQWHCECGMVNAPAVNECDMCGEEKPATAPVMAAA